MTQNPETDFLKLALFHATTVVRWRSAIDGGANGPELQASIEAEAQARKRIVDWMPISSEEAQTKLFYLVEFLTRTKSALSDAELSDIRKSIEHLI